jgi:hypothetical protein
MGKEQSEESKEARDGSQARQPTSGMARRQRSGEVCSA